MNKIHKLISLLRLKYLSLFSHLSIVSHLPLFLFSHCNLNFKISQVATYLVSPNSQMKKYQMPVYCTVVYGSLVSFFNKFLTQPSSYDTSTYNVIVPSGARTTSSSRIYRYEFIRNNASLRVPVQRLKMTISQIDQSLGGTIILVTLWQSVNIKACIDNSNC